LGLVRFGLFYPLVRRIYSRAEPAKFSKAYKSNSKGDSVLRLTDAAL